MFAAKEAKRLSADDARYRLADQGTDRQPYFGIREIVQRLNTRISMNNIFVYCEIEGGKVADVSLELLTKGRALADTLGCELEALALGQGLAGVEKQLAEYGADVVHVADCECLAPYRTLPHAAVVCGIFKEEQPQIALFGATPVGRDLGPRVSSALHSGLTADCTSLEIGPHTENKTVRSTRICSIRSVPAFGGQHHRDDHQSRSPSADGDRPRGRDEERESPHARQRRRPSGRCEEVPE